MSKSPICPWNLNFTKVERAEILFREEFAFAWDRLPLRKLVNWSRFIWLWPLTFRRNSWAFQGLTTYSPKRPSWSSHCAPTSGCCIVGLGHILDLVQIPWILLQLGCFCAKNSQQIARSMLPVVVADQIIDSDSDSESEAILVIAVVMWQSLHLRILFPSMKSQPLNLETSIKWRSQVQLPLKKFFCFCVCSCLV